MKTFSVSLLIRSSSLSLHELSLKLGRTHSTGSHTQGEPHISKDQPPWSETIWRFDSVLSKNAPLERQLEDLKNRLPPDELRALLPAHCSVCVDIAIFFDTLTVSASIARSGLQVVDAYGADLEVTCYPSSTG